jgi:hypothetical protein
MPGTDITRSDPTANSGHLLSTHSAITPFARNAGDNGLPGVRGFELANVESQRLPSHGSSAGAHWQAGQLAAHENSRVVKMTFASSNQAVRGDSTASPNAISRASSAHF